MGTLGDAVVEYPISGSYQPYSHMHVVAVSRSSSLSVLTASLSSQLMLPANPNRMNFILRNNSPAAVYIKYGAGPCDTYTYSFQVGGSSTYGYNSYHISYTGEIHCIWDSSVAASGTLKITEML